MAGQSNGSGRQWKTLGMELFAGVVIVAGVATLAVPRLRTPASPAGPPLVPKAAPLAKPLTLGQLVTPRKPLTRGKPVQTVVSSGPFTLTAVIDSPALEGQPAVLMLTLRNIGSKEQYVGGSAFEKSSFKLVVTDEKGQAAAQTVSGKWTLTPPMEVSANGTVSIEPGQKLQYRFNLARLFDLSRPGTYTVSASRVLPPNQISMTAGPLKFQMEETAAAQSGPVAYAPLPGQQTFLYMASGYDPHIARYRVGADGGLSLVYDASAGHSAPSSVSGAGPSSLVISADGRFLYAGNTTNNTVSQYRIGNDGVLSPLSPPSVPAQKFPGLLLIDPKGQFLYALSNWGNTRYTIGPDGRLTANALMPSEVWGKDRDHNIVPSDFGLINPAGTVLYACNGLAYGYHLAPDGQVTALPVPVPDAPGPNTGRSNALALLPNGQTAFVGVSTKSGSALFDLIVPMRVEKSGKLTPIPGAAQKPQVPPLPWPNYQPPECSNLIVDPSGRFLVVLNDAFLDCYRIEADGRLTFLNMAQPPSPLRLYSLFFAPGSPLLYVNNSNTSTLLSYRFDAKQGLVAAETVLPISIPVEASIASASAPTPEHWVQTVGGLAISARLPADTLTSSEPVVLTVTLQNTTAKPLSLGTVGADMSAFHLSVVGPPLPFSWMHGPNDKPVDNTVPLLAAGRDLLDTPRKDNTPLTLTPGEKRQYRFVLSRLADLTRSGAYTVQITRTLPDGKPAASLVLPLVLNDPPRAIRYAGKDWVQNVP